MMKALPTDFISAMQQLLGADEAQRLFDELTREPVVSIRLNPQSAAQGHSFPQSERLGVKRAITLPSGPSSRSTLSSMPGPTMCKRPPPCSWSR